MNRKEIAEETVRILERGAYEREGRTIDFAAEQRRSETRSRLIAPEQGAAVVDGFRRRAADGPLAGIRVANKATVAAIRSAAAQGRERVAALNFASAKNPGGGFLNGAMAQEESLAASSGLYGSLRRHGTYYRENRACGTMRYTDYAIYSPDVVFFRDERFRLLSEPVTASVLTLPAVNYGQALLKGEDEAEALRVMKDRMRLALALFADGGDRHLILGAYGCGVFRNDPVKVAGWWRELLFEERYGARFEQIVFAVLDKEEGPCIRAFEAVFGSGAPVDGGRL